MMSQSIVSYRLLQCIVSAAQFARGELTFYSNTVELVAEDNEGQTTAPLSLEYDCILHFRVMRGEHFVRITVPRPLVQPWAESNGFLSQLDLPSDIHCDTQDAKQRTSGQNITTSDNCDLLGQLDEGDFAHFIATVAPMVAATRRGRSRSRLSMTDPLPVGCYVPEPAEMMSHNDDKRDEEAEGEEEGEDDTLCHTSEKELPQSEEVEEKPAESAIKHKSSLPAAGTAETDAALPSRVPTEDNGSGSSEQAAADECVIEDHNKRDAAEILTTSAAEAQLQAAVAELEFGSNTTDAIPHLLRPTRHIPMGNKYITTTTTAVIPAVGSISVSPSLTSTHNTITTEKQQTTQQKQYHPSATARRRKRVHEADSSEECMSAAAETTTKTKSRRTGNAADPFIADNDAVKASHTDAASPTSASTHVQDVLQNITDVNRTTEEKEEKEAITVAKATAEKPTTKKLVRGLVSSIQPDMLTAFMPPPRRPRTHKAPQKAALRALFQFTSRDSSHNTTAPDDKGSTTAAEEVNRMKRPYGKRTKGTRKEKPQEGQQRRQWSRRKKTTVHFGMAEAQAVQLVDAEVSDAKDEKKEVVGSSHENTCKASNAAAAEDVPTEAEVIHEKDTKEQVKSDEASKRESTTQQQRPFPLLLLDPEVNERHQQTERNARNSNTPPPQQQEESTPDMICTQQEIQPSNDDNDNEEEEYYVGSDSGDSGAAHGTPRETCAAAECAQLNKDTHSVKKPQASVIRADSQAACRLTEFITDNKSNGVQQLSIKQVDRSNNPSPRNSNNKNAFAQCEGSRSSCVRRLMHEFNILSHGIALVQECQEQVRSMLLDLIADGDI